MVRQGHPYGGPMAAALLAFALLQQLVTPLAAAPQESAAARELQLLVADDQQPPMVSAGRFDPSRFNNIREAIQSHPELRKFASLCEKKEVDEIVSISSTPLTVFAPIDRSLSDLMEKSESHSINLIELAKHHIVQGYVTSDENTRFPFQVYSYTRSSPLYLQQAHDKSLFVNNARILVTYQITINSDSFHTLHVIDAPLDYIYMSSKKRSGQNHQLVKRPLSLDDLWADSAASALVEFQARFSDLSAGSSQVDLSHARAYKDSQANQRLLLDRDELQLGPLASAVRSQAQLKGKLFNVNETSSYNTYFLPVNSLEASDGLKALLSNPSALEAHIIPDQVLFTRSFGLGQAHTSLLDTGGQRVSLSLAKSVPPLGDDIEQVSKRLLAAPLVAQSKSVSRLPADLNNARSGVVSAEVVLANIPVSNGVLHLIRKPLALPTTRLLEYINDSDNQLSQIVSAHGSQTGNGKSRAPQLRHFRDLLAKEQQQLSRLVTGSSTKLTILAPTDEAFERLRYDMRALVTGDESLIPRHWDANYRRDLLERLVRRHVILDQTVTSDLVEASGELDALSENGKALKFVREDNELLVESDRTRAHLDQFDLAGSDGVLHIIDRVLGEEEETVHSLLSSIVLKLNQSTGEPLLSQLHQLVQSNLRSLRPAPFEPAPGAASSSPELELVSKSIGQFLGELGEQHQRLLASSVNVSYQLARLSSLADGYEDWNDKFKSAERLFTFFVPSDLAWLNLQRTQPELYKPLMYFLDQQASSELDAGHELEPAPKQPASLVRQPRSSESSQRLRQILDRHLVVGNRIKPEELNRMDSIKTLNAVLELVPHGPVHQHHLTGNANNLPDPAGAPIQAAALRAAADSTVSLPTGSSTTRINKALRLKDFSEANIVQTNGASNGFVYIIDHVLLQQDDSDHLLQTSTAPAISSTMSSLLGAHNSMILDFIHHLNSQSFLALISTLTLAIVSLIVVALVLVVRRRRMAKLTRHQHLESGLTSSSAASQTGSTSTTKSL